MEASEPFRRNFFLRKAISALALLLYASSCGFVSAYGESYYYNQGYYYAQAYYYAQGYYYSQGYYQGYYQGSYALTLTQNTTFSQNLYVVGSVGKGSGTFMIDHPLDPKNELLFHSFVESPDVKNIYDGIAVLDGNGNATIPLPDYFLALNKDFRYLASGVSDAMPNLHLAHQVYRQWFIGKPIFAIAGGKPGGIISWQVTGIRKDPLILKNPIITEVEKTDDTLVKKGECIFPPLCAP